MFFLGVAFVAAGLFAEAVLGTRFKHFFNPRYSYAVDGWRNDYVMKVRLGRLSLCVGVLLTLVGGLSVLV